MLGELFIVGAGAILDNLLPERWSSSSPSWAEQEQQLVPALCVSKVSFAFTLAFVSTTVCCCIGGSFIIWVERARALVVAVEGTTTVAILFLLLLSVGSLLLSVLLLLRRRPPFSTLYRA